MKHRTINVLLLILSALGCDSKSKLTPELLVIKNLYNIPCYEFSMDTLKSFDRLFNFAKLQFHEYGDSCLYVGFVLNLSDSSFTPSPDKSMNCVIPCGQAGPLILKWVPINDFYVKDLENDSLTIEYTTRESPERIHINELASYFDKHLKQIFLGNSLELVKPILINIEVSNIPSKELFYDVFNILFWNCYNKCFEIINASSSINLEEIVKNPKTDLLELFGYKIPIWIMLSDSTVSNKRVPILVEI